MDKRDEIAYKRNLILNFLLNTSEDSWYVISNMNQASMFDEKEIILVYSDLIEKNYIEMQTNNSTRMVSIKPKGRQFIINGGYSSSSSRLKRIIRRITHNIETILLGLILAYLIYKFGLNK